MPAGPAPATMMSYCCCFGTVWKAGGSGARGAGGFSSDVPSTETPMSLSGPVVLGLQSYWIRLAERKARIARQLSLYFDPEIWSREEGVSRASFCAMAKREVMVWKIISPAEGLSRTSSCSCWRSKRATRHFVTARTDTMLAVPMKIGVSPEESPETLQPG